MHYQTQRLLRKFLEAAVSNLTTAIGDPEIRSRMESVRECGTFYINCHGSFIKQADVSFVERGPGRLPSLVCEIS
jgi:hypothetical protein